jgi:hypothetical protein
MLPPRRTRLSLRANRLVVMADRPSCDMRHERARRAVVRVQVKSTRVGKQGHPMTREYLLCAEHARELRALGFELVST